MCLLVIGTARIFLADKTPIAARPSPPPSVIKQMSVRGPRPSFVVPRGTN